MAKSKSTSSAPSLEIAAEAFRQVDALYKKYGAQRREVFNEILKHDAAGGEPSTDEQFLAAENFAARVRARLNGDVASIVTAAPVGRGIDVGKLRRDLAELDHILQVLLPRDEIARRAALVAEYNLANGQEWDTDERELSSALLRVRRLAASMHRKSVETLAATGCRRGRPVDGLLAQLLRTDSVEAELLRELVLAGVIDQRDLEAAGG